MIILDTRIWIWGVDQIGGLLIDPLCGILQLTKVSVADY